MLQFRAWMNGKLEYPNRINPDNVSAWENNVALAIADVIWVCKHSASLA